MATNPYIDNLQYDQTQSLHEDLLIESIQMYGMDVEYLPRTLYDVDKVFGEPAHTAFNKAIVIEMYLNNVDGFDGEGDLLSKFGVEIRDQATFWVARRRFEEESENWDLANTEQMFYNYPREGDLIHLPMNGNIFQIQFVENEKLFYNQGRLMLYELTCELFEYSGETFATGNGIIDEVSTKYSVGNTTYNQPSDNEQFNLEMDNIVDFTENNPFSEIW